jgi:hypothetical protein
VKLNISFLSRINQNVAPAPLDVNAASSSTSPSRAIRSLRGYSGIEALIPSSTHSAIIKRGRGSGGFLCAGVFCCAGTKHENVKITKTLNSFIVRSTYAQLRRNATCLKLKNNLARAVASLRQGAVFARFKRPVARVAEWQTLRT